MSGSSQTMPPAGAWFRAGLDEVSDALQLEFPANKIQLYNEFKKFMNNVHLDHLILGIAKEKSFGFTWLPCLTTCAKAGIDKK